MWHKQMQSQRATTRQTSSSSSNADGGSDSDRKADPGGRLEFRRKIETTLVPALRAFNPDLIMISAGFDGVKHDVGNKQLQRDWEGLDLNSGIVCVWCMCSVVYVECV
jgi:acetoin utilization deacetylase AcuC-like enzyme